MSPDLYEAMAGLQNYVEASGLDRKLLDLVKIRASQINGCAYLHRYAYQRCAQAWRKRRVDASAQCLARSTNFSARERAALAWTEAVTKISDHHVPNEVYDEARRHFSEKELVDLTAAVIAINAWNRAAIAFRATPRLTSAKLAA